MPIILYLLYSLLGLAQLVAYLAGIQLWLGVGAPIGLIIFFVTTMVLPFGPFVNAIIGFYGAYAVWGWPWWQAALLTFPFAILGIVVMGLSSVMGIAALIFQRRQES